MEHAELGGGQGDGGGPSAPGIDMHAPRRPAKAPLLVHLDASCPPGLCQALREAPEWFSETEAASAQAIIFGDDDIAYVNRSTLYRTYPSKCICITESDIPTFRLPGLYAANQGFLANAARTRTVSYFISERERGNEEVHRLIGETVEKRYLYSFMGSSNSWPRKQLLREHFPEADALVEATDAHYNHWQSDSDQQQAQQQQRRRYAQVMAASKFALCPRGCGVSSYRLFESMSLGVAPVIVSDSWTPIDGIDWRFALFVREKDITKLDSIVRAHEAEWQQRGQAGLAIYRSRLAGNLIAPLIYDKVNEVLAAYDHRREVLMAQATRARAAGREAYWAGRKVAKFAVLWGFYLARRDLPISLNRPLDVQLKRTPGAK